MVEYLATTALALASGVSAGWAYVTFRNRQLLGLAKEEGELIVERAQSQAARRRQEEETRLRKRALAAREEHQAEKRAIEERFVAEEEELSELEHVVAARRESIDQDYEALSERRQAMQRRREAAEALDAKRDEVIAEGARTVEERAGTTRDLCRAAMVERLVESAKATAADQRRQLEQAQADPSHVRAAKRLIGIATGRIDRRYQAERHMYTVEIPPDRREHVEGAEGHNLAQLEEFGVTLTWNEDDTLRITGSDGVARTVARRVLQRLVSKKGPKKDATELLEAATKEMDAEVMGLGKKAFRMLGLKVAHPEITELVGRLYYRTSYSQNQWEHAIEASYIAGLIAGELGLDVKLARRATLLHDIGKALTPMVEGSHALIGGEIARRVGEREEVANAIAAHHAEEPAASVYAPLVAACDAMSGARPGARREPVDTYSERVTQLEDIASGMKGVSRAHVVQAGREVRVMVDEKRIGDDEAKNIAEALAKKISEDLVFPGQILVTVIREYSTVEVAN